MPLLQDHSFIWILCPMDRRLSHAEYNRMALFVRVSILVVIVFLQWTILASQCPNDGSITIPY